MADGTDTDTFIPAGKAIAAVVVNLAARRDLMRDLKGSVVLLDAKRRQDDFKSLEVKRGRELITKGLGLIQTNGCPEEAIQYLRDTLAAISGSTA